MTPLTSRALLALARRGKPGAVLAARLVGARGEGDTEVPGRHDLYRELWDEAAARCGVTVVELGDGFLALERDGRRRIVFDNQAPLDDPVTLRLAAHKTAAARLLGEAGIPTPVHAAYSIDDLRPARRFLAAHGRCVVKPVADTGAGLGVTCGVESADDLARASVRAARWSRSLVVEHQAVGEEYRLLVLDGRVLGGLRRRPPRVVGDGRSTVAELVAQENERRRAARGRLGLWLLSLDLDATLALARQGLGVRAIPTVGGVVEIGTTVNENGPADNETVDVPPALEATALAAVRALGLRLASVEVVTSDPAVPITGNDGVVVEVNGTPGWHYHAQVADPTSAVDVATPILETLFAQDDRP